MSREIPGAEPDRPTRSELIEIIAKMFDLPKEIIMGVVEIEEVQ